MSPAEWYATQYRKRKERERIEKENEEEHF